MNAFNRKQNKVHVDLLTVSGIESKTLLAVAGGDPPDVAGLYGPNMAQYADDNAIIPLDDFCREKGISAADYIPVFWDMGTIRGMSMRFPARPPPPPSTTIKQMFRDAGLDPEKPPQTIEEMDADADKITTRNAQGKLDKAGFMPAEPGWWNWGWGYVFGGKLWDGKTKITANSPETSGRSSGCSPTRSKYGAAQLQTLPQRLRQLLLPAERLPLQQSRDGAAGRLDVQLHRSVCAADWRSRC